MGMLDKFIEYLKSHVDKSIYVWGAQGQDLTTLADSKIRGMETSTINANTAIKMKNARKHLNGAKAFDCSGLAMYFLQNLHGIFPCDINSNGLMGKCVKIQKSHVKKGDWLFRTKSGRAYHIGYMISDTEYVEAKGRAYGVIKGVLAKSGTYWDTFGRPEIFKDEIDTKEEQVEHASFNRILKKGCKGNDVCELQKLLNKNGDNIIADGSFGSKTKAAVKAFQKKKRLKADGIAGKDTITALGGKWMVATATSAKKVSFDKILKRGSKGNEVKELQILLNRVGYNLDVDGSFGPKTVVAVKDFQRKNNLVVDGIVGKNTILKLGGSWK